MKKYLLSLLLFGLSFIWFSNAQFVWEVECPKSGCYNSSCDYCPVSSQYSSYWVRCEWNWELMIIQKKWDNISALWKSCPWTFYNSNGYEIIGIAWVQNTVVGYYYWPSSKMPVSTLSPVISWLSNAINEFIPYVVYVGLGVLGVIIWFVAIKWLLRYTKWKTLGVFKSRRKK